MMAYWEEVCVAKSEDPSLIPRIHRMEEKN